jgi:hypothetical protein
MAEAYKMFRSERVLATFNFAGIVGAPYNDPLTDTPTAPAVSFDPTGGLALIGSPALYTTTVTALIDGASGTQGTAYVVKCVAYTAAGQKLEINGQITVRNDNEVP